MEENRLDPERWAQVVALFETLSEATEAERAAVLGRLASESPDVHAIIKRMLRDDASSGLALDFGIRTAAHLVEDADEPQSGDAAREQTTGRRVGPYVIRRELAHGGMGVVYLAERDDPDFAQVVALKCLPPGMASAELMSRFLRERRILAGLVHPNIAQLHDGGFTESGEPYFVMEYVEGERITDYCDRRQLSVDARLQLFVTVCEAVQYAHQHLVVHRDLKPANVFVTSDGRVKLLDFGIAKLLTDPGASDSAVSITTRALTPEYASPEQIRGEPVTAASDVFSLGLLLFEMLTGRRPFTPAAGPLGTIQAVLDTDPARASATTGESPRNRSAGVAQQIESAPTGSAARARARGTTPERLRRRLRGDLDTILDKTLRKEPHARYASAQALLDDVRHHLTGLPVQARPQSHRYRAAKFARRHRVGLAAAVVVSVSVVGGISATLWQSRVATRERDTALLESAKASRVTAFLVGIFGAADPAEARGENLTAREILDRGAGRIEQELADEPVVQATVQRAIGRIYFGLGNYDQAGLLFERSLATHRRLLPADDPEVIEGLHASADLAARIGGNADSLYQLLLAMRLRTLSPDDPKVADALRALGGARTGSDAASADTLLRRALVIYQLTPGREADASLAIYELGLVHHQKGEFEEAERLYRDALAIQQRVRGADHPTTLTTMSNLGWLLQVRGNFLGADSVLRQALAVRRRVLGDRHTAVAATLGGLGEVANRLGRYDDAHAFFSEALSIQKESFPPGSGPIVSSLTMIAGAQAAQGRTAAAHAIYREAIAELEVGGKAEGPGMARLLNNRASLFEQAGDHARATAEFRKSWQLYRANAGEDHAFTATVEGNLGASLLFQDSLVEAERLLRSALRRLTKAYSEEHASLAQVLIALGTAETRRGALSDAEATLRRSLRIAEATLPADHWRIAQAKLRLGRCLAASGDRRQAEELITTAMRTLEPVRNQRPRDHGEAVAALAAVRGAR